MNIEKAKAIFGNLVIDEPAREAIREYLNDFVAVPMNSEVRKYLLSLVVTDWHGDKPVVQFYPVEGWTPILGTFTMVRPINHPLRTNRHVVRTSHIIEVFPDGSFETDNTFFTPVTRFNQQ